MIAPIRESQARPLGADRSLASARRAVAAMLFRRKSRQLAVPAHTSRWLAWGVALWSAAFAVSYFVFHAWWKIQPY